MSLETAAENEALSEIEKLKRLKEAKSGTWYDDNWRPYCLMCNTMSRMSRRKYGFRCECCGNMIGWNLTRLKDSPLNTI